MTNHWADISNATCVIAWGANPSENHPACMAHVNRGRFPKQFFAGTARANKQPAELIVIDPRKSRTALQADRYIRIRPGTDIAFGNAIMKYVMDKVEALPATDPIRQNYFAFLNQASGSTFFVDGNATASGRGTSTGGTTGSKYTDARFLVNTVTKDYLRGKVVASTGVTTNVAPDSTTISNFPLKSADVNTSVTFSQDPGGVADGTYKTVYQLMKEHLTPYTTATAADICGCTEEEIKYVADRMLANSRFASFAAAAPNSIIKVPVNPDYRATTLLYAMGITQHTYGSQNVKMFAQLQILFGNMGRAGGGINALRGIHNVQGSTDMGLLYGNIPAYSGNPANAEAEAVTLNAQDAVALQWKNFDNTAVTVGAVNLNGTTKYQATDYVLSVDGTTGKTMIARSATSTIPDGATVFVSYSHLVAAGVAGPDKVYNAFGKYMDALWGYPLSGTDFRSLMNSSYDDAYDNRFGIAGGTAGNQTDQVMALQQRGFYNMTLKWFSDYAAINAMPYTSAAEKAAKRAAIDKAYSLWPKGNGLQHVTMFRNMAKTDASAIKAAVVWGQNPAITEPNQGKVRAGLKNLDLLVCVDMFQNETAACDRKDGSVTYLIPAAAHVEKAGSVTNSGRTLQWRYQAVPTSGNSKDDTELLLRFAKALNDADVFSHLESVNGWAAKGAYAKLYGTPYLYTPIAGANNYKDVVSAATDVDYATLGVSVSNPTTYAKIQAKGSEAVTETVYREMTTSSNGGGTIWIYTNGYSTNLTTNRHTGQDAWATANRAKSRDRKDPNGTLASPGWGYAWLVNRRVLYNNNPTTYFTDTDTSVHEVPGDVNDYFMGPDTVARFFVSTNPATLNYARWYRTIHRMADVPKTPAGANPSIHLLPGRFPSHTEPYESPRDGSNAALGTNLVGTWGYNSSGTAANLVPADTARGTAAEYPLILTTIRCVEHFQGGPITRNNPYNHEAEPEPWIELNSSDARAAGIKDGDWVKIVTARTDATKIPAYAGDSIESAFPQAKYGQGFKARVGSGLQSNQRVAQGVVAIPWHWGEKGLSTGSRANDLCIDAVDANSAIPESKACLCRIEKI